MSIQQRAVIVSDERLNHQTVRGLRDALAKLGLKQTLCTTSLTEISNVVIASQWPIIFIDHDPENADGLRQFERIYRFSGNQFFHYFIILPTDEKTIAKCFKSLGFSGVIRKPIQPAQISEVISPFVSKSPDSTTKSAYDFCLAMLKKDYTFTDNILKTLRQNHKYKLKSEIARAYLNDAQGAGTKTMTIFQKLMKEELVELRTLCEYAHFLKKFSIYDECKTVMARIRQTQPQLFTKIWEEICFLSEIENLDEVAKILEEMGDVEPNKSYADSSFARMIYTFGLENKVKDMLGAKSIELPAFELLVQRELQKERERQERAAAAQAAKSA